MKGKVKLENKNIHLVVHSNGGAMVDFSQKENNFNPLSFEFLMEQMPANNKGGAPYRGHFICLGRWGEPSEAEKMHGIMNHGDFSNIQWEVEKLPGTTETIMNVVSHLEGLKLERKITLDVQMPVYKVTEKVTNIQKLGRVYNWVQHPTLTSPALDQNTLIDCNGDLGFDQSFERSPEEKILKWSSTNLKGGLEADMSDLKSQKDSVFTFKVNEKDELGWVTAYFPVKGVLLGYLWKRQEYPWIHHWLHFEDSMIKYRGMEFGTAGIHQPFKDIITKYSRVFDLLTFDYLEAGECKEKEFISFIADKGADFQGVEKLDFQNGVLQIHEKSTQNLTRIVTDFKQFI